MGGGTFCPWVNTPADGYIYDLSLVATATSVFCTALRQVFPPIPRVPSPAMPSSKRGASCVPRCPSSVGTSLRPQWRPSPLQGCRVSGGGRTNDIVTRGLPWGQCSASLSPLTSERSTTLPISERRAPPKRRRHKRCVLYRRSVQCASLLFSLKRQEPVAVWLGGLQSRHGT